MNSNFVIALPIRRNEHVWFRNVNRHIWFKTLPLQKRLNGAVGILLKFISPFLSRFTAKLALIEHLKIKLNRL